jgi:hypothetical protein
VELQGGPDQFSLNLQDGTSLKFYSQCDPATGAAFTAPHQDRVTLDVVPDMSHTAWMERLEMGDEARAARLAVESLAGSGARGMLAGLLTPPRS